MGFESPRICECYCKVDHCWRKKNYRRIIFISNTSPNRSRSKDQNIIPTSSLQIPNHQNLKHAKNIHQTILFVPNPNLLRPSPILSLSSLSSLLSPLSIPTVPLFPSLNPYTAPIPPPPPPQSPTTSLKVYHKSFPLLPTSIDQTSNPPTKFIIPSPSIILPHPYLSTETKSIKNNLPIHDCPPLPSSILLLSYFHTDGKYAPSLILPIPERIKYPRNPKKTRTSNN